MPFDLSQVMFIATANVLDPIPARCATGWRSSSSPATPSDEKVAIAAPLPDARSSSSATASERSRSAFADDAVCARSSATTRARPGVRNLEREIAALCRKVAAARRRGQGRAAPGVDAAKRARARSARSGSPTRCGDGPPTRRRHRPRVDAGGGDVLFVEATAMPGKGALTLTGQLGDVMKESAQAALSWVRAPRRRRSGSVDADWFAEHDIHVHVPAGAIPKDGPSAGVTIATALASLVTGRAVSEDVAMTGEITLPGKVLPIGGVKEKVLAAPSAPASARSSCRARTSRISRTFPRRRPRAHRGSSSPTRSTT